MLLVVALYAINTATLRCGIPTATLSDERNAYNQLNRQQRLTLTLTLTQMLETLSGDGMSSTLLIVGVCATTRAVTGDLDIHMPCKHPASPVPIPGVHIEVVYGTRGCPGVMDTRDYRSELIIMYTYCGGYPV